VGTRSQRELLDALIGYWQDRSRTGPELPRFASDPDADKLVRENLFAFLLAASLDRGGQAFALWNTPHRLRQQWGHLDPALIQHMVPEELAADPVIVHAPSQISRLQLAKTVVSLAQVVQRDCDGQPERLLEGSIADIMDSLQQVFGVGPGIARMVVIQRILFFGLEPERRGRLLPKIDVHVQRVLERTGLVAAATDEDVAHMLTDRPMQDIAAIDQACWDIGRQYCRPNEPKCGQCPADHGCAKVGIASAGREGSAEPEEGSAQTRRRKGPTFTFTRRLPEGMTPEEARERCLEAIRSLARRERA
jgi:endonuclease-3